MKKKIKFLNIPKAKLDKSLDGKFENLPVILKKASEMEDFLKKARKTTP